MSLGLDPKCLERLSAVIGEKLKSVTVKNNFFLDSFFSLFDAEAVLPEKGKIRDTLEQYISETPIFTFLHETLSKELRESQEFNIEDSITKLSNLPNYKDTFSVAKRLVSDFESLPWEYMLSIPLPLNFSRLFCKNIKEFSISGTIRLVTPDNLSNDFPLSTNINLKNIVQSDNSLASILSRESVSEWNREITYLQISSKGFIGYWNTTILDQVIANFKAFFGIGIALRLFKSTRNYLDPSRVRFYIHQKLSNKWVVLRSNSLDLDQSVTINDLILDDLDGKLRSDKAREKWMRQALSKIACVFSHQKRSQKLILASEWLFDSYCGSDELLAFVRTAVVLEILLGDKKEAEVMGLSELLRNRCAYLISDSYAERESILNDFRKIYDVRSKIVHAGKKRLNNEERFLFYKLQSLCWRVIQKEIDLLEKDSSKSE